MNSGPRSHPPTVIPLRGIEGGDKNGFLPLALPQGRGGGLGRGSVYLTSTFLPPTMLIPFCRVFTR